MVDVAVPGPVTSPMVIYGASLRRAGSGGTAPLALVDDQGVSRWKVDARAWGTLRPGDGSVLDRCRAATVDVGCGPGRLVAALAGSGRPALGVDVCAEAVRQTRRRGAVAVHGSVFDPVPGEGTWRHVLLVDGNIGIGGDPVRLLDRVAGLLGEGGTVVVEVEPPGAPTWSAQVRLTDGARHSRPFPWATVASDELAALARGTSLGVRDRWRESGRWFAELVAS